MPDVGETATGTQTMNRQFSSAFERLCENEVNVLKETKVTDVPMATSTDSKTNSIDTAGSADPEGIAEALRELNRHAENIENMLARIIQDLEQPWRH